MGARVSGPWSVGEYARWQRRGYRDVGLAEMAISRRAARLGSVLADLGHARRGPSRPAVAASVLELDIFPWFGHGGIVCARWAAAAAGGKEGARGDARPLVMDGCADGKGEGTARSRGGQADLRWWAEQLKRAGLGWEERN